MKKIVLCRSVSEDYQQAFSDHNFEVIFVEPLQFLFINVEELCTKLVATDYDGLILTSPRAIEALAKCWDPTKFVIWNTKRVYTLGEASCKRIKLLLGLEALGMTAGSAENLAKIVVSDSNESSKFLFPCGNLSSELLPSMLQSKDISVDSLTVYETKENDNLRTHLMELNDSDDDLCCMVFFSPSGCEYIHRQLQTFNNKLFHLPHFAIGNSTAHKIENLGMEIAGVAAKPKAESVMESVQNYFKAPTSCS